MPRLVNPTGWQLHSGSAEKGSQGPLVQFRNRKGHTFSVHPVDERLVRVVHELPSRVGGIRLRCADGVQWEKRRGGKWEVKRLLVLLQTLSASKVTLLSPGAAAEQGGLRIDVDYALHLQLTWLWESPTKEPVELLKDFKKSYTYDEVSGRVWHYICREGYIPQNEHQPNSSDLTVPFTHQNEFIYGLGECKGRLNKLGKRYIIDGRDSLGADSQETDPLYKLTPFVARYNAQTKFWHGIYYNSLNPSVFDLGAEHDFSTGNFQSFSTEHGPLDYYVMLGSHLPSQSGNIRPSLAGIVSQMARLVTPSSCSRAGCSSDGWQASPCLPSIKQFGYLASSLTLSEREDAQQAIIDYVEETRRKRFPIDAMHLSSGYCQHPATFERQYFEWNKQRCPDPSELGKHLERDLQCQVVINVKPWLLESHPRYRELARSGAFVRAAADIRGSSAEQKMDGDRCGSDQQSLTMHWSTSMGQTARGSYFDFSSSAGDDAWQTLIRKAILANNITGAWIDNNEFSTLVDDADEFAGERDLWTVPKTPRGPNNLLNGLARQASEVSCRMCDLSRSAAAGAWGRAVQTMGMARSTFSALIADRPDDRPVIVTRSAVPGMQAFAHATWSGDNSTTWASLRGSTALTLSYGLSFGCGLYGHDIGGFAGDQSPSAELLIRWCQHASWHTRFTVHSWKQISTTLWMYDHVPLEGNPDRSVTDLLRDIVEWRYRLIPLLYSLYVTDYHRHGWPVLKTLLWYHGDSDRATLTQDEQFLLGSHILIAPVTRYGQREVTFHLPTHVDDPASLELGGHGQECWWYSPSLASWIPASQPSSEAASPGQVLTRMVMLPAPLHENLYLVRAGGILVQTGPPGSEGFQNTRSTSPFVEGGVVRERHITLYPLPAASVAGVAPDSDANVSGRSGSFTLVEDDGVTNAATRDGHFTEVEISFECISAPLGEADGRLADVVLVSLDIIRAGYEGAWLLKIHLVEGDSRPMRLQHPMGVRDDCGNVVETHVRRIATLGEDQPVELVVDLKIRQGDQSTDVRSKTTSQTRQMRRQS